MQKHAHYFSVFLYVFGLGRAGAWSVDSPAYQAYHVGWGFKNHRLWSPQFVGTWAVLWKWWMWIQRTWDG